VEEEALEEEGADKGRVSADQHLVAVHNADTQLLILVEHHAPV
jgi:hypothetical protein